MPDRELAEALWRQDDLKELYQRAREVDIALLSVGDVSKQASIFRRDVLNWSDAQSLRAAGAVGDVLCHFVDADGKVIDHPLIIGPWRSIRPISGTFAGSSFRPGGFGKFTQSAPVSSRQTPDC